MEKNGEETEIFEVRSKCADRLTVKEAKILFKDLSAPDCTYKVLNIRTVISPEIVELLFKSLSKNKSITSIFGEHMFAHESTYLKVLKKSLELPLKALVLSCPEPPKKLASYFKQKLQLTRLSLAFFGGDTSTPNQPKLDLDEAIEAIGTNMNTLEHFTMVLSANIEVSPSGVETLLRNNQGLRSVSIDIGAFKCHHRMIFKRLSALSAVLATLPQLTTLKFLLDSFDGFDVEAFIGGLKGNKTITELHLNQYWFDIRSKQLIEYVLSLEALKTLRLKAYTELERYLDNVNENNLIDVSKFFDNQSQLREIECNFTPFMKERLLSALETNTNLRRVYIHPLESPRMIMRLYEELDDRLNIDICHESLEHLPYELVLEHHHRSTRRKNYLSIKSNLQAISSARDRGLFALLPQEVLEVIWFQLLSSIMEVDVKQAMMIFHQLGERYRK